MTHILPSRLLEIYPAALPEISDLKIIELTHSQENKDLFAALNIGARAYLSKFIDMKQLIHSIELVHDGEIIISPPMAGMLLKEFADTYEPNAEEKAAQQAANTSGAGYDYRSSHAHPLTSNQAVNVELSPRKKKF